MDVIIWFLLLEVIGIISVPIMYKLCTGLKDRGYSFSKVFGCIIFAYVLWIVSIFNIFPIVFFTCLSFLLLFAGFSFLILWKSYKEIIKHLRIHWKMFLIMEFLFAFVFIIFLFYRGWDSGINHTEQLMDFMYFNASLTTQAGTPKDLWLSGHSVAYYYFGYWVMAILAKTSNVVAGVSYNLSLVTIPALSAVGVYGLAYNLAYDVSKKGLAVFFGLFSSYCLVFLANIVGFFEFLWANGIGSEKFWSWIGITGLSGESTVQTTTWYPEGFWWWWRSSRVISSTVDQQQVDVTINEFPFFSFLLGDLHPHVIAIPVFLMFLGFCLNILWAGVGDKRKYIVGFIVIGFISGVLFSINPWLIPPMVLILLGVLITVNLETSSYPQVSKKIPWLLFGGGLAFATSIVAFMPGISILQDLSTQVSGVSPVGNYKELASVTSRYIHILIFWGPYIILLLPFVILTFFKTTLEKSWRSLSYSALFLVSMPFLIWVVLHFVYGGEVSAIGDRWLYLLPYFVLMWLSIYSTLWMWTYRISDRNMIFSLLLIFVSLILIQFPEILFLDDNFSSPTERMNTVFKFYYASWILLATVSGYTIYCMMNKFAPYFKLKKSLFLLYALLFIVFLGSSYYTVAAFKYNVDNSELEEFNLNGVSVWKADERQAIEYFKQNANYTDVILEAVGPDYSQFSRISSGTGLATVLGWVGHEYQWRGNLEIINQRKDDIVRLYSSVDVDESQTLINKYDIEYIYIGENERNIYGDQGINKFYKIMDLVYKESGVLIFKRRNS